MDVSTLPTAAETWPQAVVTIFTIIAIAIVPGILTYLTARASRTAVTTLTKNNGGSSVKDQLDRIEAGQADIRERVTALESKANPKRKRSI